MFPLAFALVGCALGGVQGDRSEDGGELLGVRILPRTGDRAMPHVVGHVPPALAPEVRGGRRLRAQVVLDATWYSFRVALAAFVVGTLLGIVLAVVMARFRVVERAIMPYLVHLADRADHRARPADRVADGVRQPRPRGRHAGSPRSRSACSSRSSRSRSARSAGCSRRSPAALELMDSLASPWWRTLFKLRFPAAVPFIAPSLRLAGAAAVVGVVVAEISLGRPAGVGRLILAYGQEASSDPPKMFAAVFGAAVLGLVMSLVVVGDRLGAVVATGHRRSRMSGDQSGGSGDRRRQDVRRRRAGSTSTRSSTSTW